MKNLAQKKANEEKQESESMVIESHDNAGNTINDTDNVDDKEMETI